MKPTLKVWGLFATGLLMIGVVGINALAIMHGRSMTTLIAKGEHRTRPPED